MDSQQQLSQSEQLEAVRSLQAGLKLGEISIEQVCANAAALDGALTGVEVAAVLEGARTCTAHEHDVVAQAINDQFIDGGGDHPVRYSDELGRVGGN